MISVILWTILAYVLYKFIFRFLLPLFMVSRQMKKQVRQFRDHMEQQQQQHFQQQEAGSASKPNSDASKERAGDYIDFEEVK